MTAYLTAMSKISGGRVVAVRQVGDLDLARYLSTQEMKLMAAGSAVAGGYMLIDYIVDGVARKILVPIQGIASGLSQ